MPETAIAVRETSAVILSKEQLNYISKTDFVPKALRGNLPAIMACVATGRALGIPDMTALRSIHIIDGKASYSAELMVQLVRAHGHSITGGVSEDQATATGKRSDTGDTMTVTWTMAMAERAQLLNKDNWKKYPEAMLWARAVSQLCRMLFADCFAGATYTPEEIGSEMPDGVVDGEIVDEPTDDVEPGLSMDALRARMHDQGVTVDDLTAIKQRLYPDVKRVVDLDDQQRLAVWTEATKAAA